LTGIARTGIFPFPQKKHFSKTGACILWHLGHSTFIIFPQFSQYTSKKVGFWQKMQ
jgi:hypothetical protein